MDPEPDFYIGWQQRAPGRTARFARKAVIAIGLAAAAVAGITALAQRQTGPAIFEFGSSKSFTGILEKSPYPHLLVPRPGTTSEGDEFSRYYLVSPFKFGVPAEVADTYDGRPVSLEGTLIYRGDQTMIEVIPGSVSPAADEGEISPQPAPPADLGTFTFQGQIVDSKCYLGVMNPGELETHRACAIRCISGGIPPVLLVRKDDGSPVYLLLTDEQGGAVNDAVLDLVAVPVEITGTLSRQGDMLTLKSDPATYRRVNES